MNRHFDEYLDVRSLFKWRPVKHVLELGAAGGENTEHLLGVCEKVTVVSDWYPPERFKSAPAERLRWIFGVSYVEMDRLPEHTFGAIIIDTDHNYWTLMEELKRVERLLCDPGWLILHDTTMFGSASGHMASYCADVPYPMDQIVACEQDHKSMLDALKEWLDTNPAYALIRQDSRSNGAMALMRGWQAEPVEVR